MSRSVQTITFMPFASVVDCTWSRPGTRAGADFTGLVAAEATPAVNRPRVNSPTVNRPMVESRWALTTRTNDWDMRHLVKEVQLYECDAGKEKRRRRGKSSAAPRSEHRGRLFAVLLRVLPRNLDGVDRGELRAGEPGIDGSEHHAATASALHHHSRHRGPRARDTLGVGENQRHCGSRHHV